MNTGKKKVVVGMSGGVDSSVAAYLLKEQGYEVIGVTMQIWQSEDLCSIQNQGCCCGLNAVEDARRVADILDIPYYVMNFRNVFKEKVIDDFVQEYAAGNTPNPCIRCNRYVKWEALLERSLDIGADYIATGHYAQIKRLPNGRHAICRSVTRQKDQTYALYNLTQEQLAHTLMPIGAYTKEEVRAIAEKIGLSVAGKPDSQEICFITDQDYIGFLEKEWSVKETDKKAKCQMPPQGNFVTADGQILGTHKGIHHYTIGQRKGLGMAFGTPMFVCDIRSESNEVVLGSNADTYTDVLVCNRLNHMAVSDYKDCRNVTAKIRYGQQETKCSLTYLDSDTLSCRFAEPVRAVTPGQAVVFYENEVVLGGGIISRTAHSTGCV